MCHNGMELIVRARARAQFNEKGLTYVAFARAKLEACPRDMAKAMELEENEITKDDCCEHCMLMTWLQLKWQP